MVQSSIPVFGRQRQADLWEFEASLIWLQSMQELHSEIVSKIKQRKKKNNKKDDLCTPSTECYQVSCVNDLNNIGIYCIAFPTNIFKRRI